MRKTLTAFILVLVTVLSCASCAPSPSSQDGDNAIHVAATTYPVYLFTTAVAEGAEGIQVELMIQQTTSCLHDYTLTVNDMKVVERADILVLNGGGLENFLSDVLASSEADIIDSSVGIDLLDATGHHHDHEGGHDNHHDHAHEDDPHFWMSPENALTMLENICIGLSRLDPGNAELYRVNLDKAVAALPGNPLSGDRLACPYLITFHDGFQYFALDSGLTLLKAIEEEEGAEASSADIKEIIELIHTYGIPAIFTEINGSDSTAQAISRETGVEVYPLNLIMSGEDSGIQPYVEALEYNYATILQALGGN